MNPGYTSHRLNTRNHNGSCLPRVLQRTEIESLRDSGVRISQQSKYPDSAWQAWHSGRRASTAPHLYVVQSLVSSKNSDLSSPADYHLPNWKVYVFITRPCSTSPGLYPSAWVVRPVEAAGPLSSESSHSSRKNTHQSEKHEKSNVQALG